MRELFKHEDLRLPTEERRNLYNSILDEGTLDPAYLTMLALAALIALLGLLQNSAAVIISAMEDPTCSNTNRRDNRSHFSGCGENTSFQCKWCPGSSNYYDLVL